MTSIIGYARTVRSDDDGSKQVSELQAAGAEQVFIDRSARSGLAERLQWLICVESLRAGDTLLVRGLDCLGGTERLVLEIVQDLEVRGAELRTLSEPVIDTAAPGGRASFAMVRALARVGTSTRSEETRRGLDRARAAGRVGGRPSVMTPPRLREARRMRASGSSVVQIAEALGVGKSSVARALAKEAPAQERVFYRDVKPYELPLALDDLVGPSAGVIELPHHVHWGPEVTVDLRAPGGVAKAYQALLTEGTSKDQEALLDRGLLASLWKELDLPDRVRLLWETRFPELAGA
ncbi:DNA invertase Pin-like site-specific DNA recombinase [Rathayibacter sp. PhB127]|uniref:recombinase family protein n=1 Tax=Rathayibacter sp. PhB127 TaxID=2485176 RepID=UPI000F4C3CBB|nr:recombinase family protein [Rathayibacter sp. PhB127]ROS28991.1 DNA invertase Pin-like site-specific DNA recombinase [Rathayibacter sp. PhB127]